MNGTIPAGRILAVAAAVSLLGMIKTADAAPFDAATKAAVAPATGAGLLVNVADYYSYRERRVTVREYEPEYYDYDYDDRPYGYVYSARRYYYDDYDWHDHDHGGVHVRAPFVDIYIP